MLRSQSALLVVCLAASTAACIGGPPEESEDANSNVGMDASPKTDTTDKRDAGGEANNLDEDAADLPDAGNGTRFVEVTAGERVACALTDDGRPLCWGRNTNGGVKLPVSEAAPPTFPFDDVRFVSLQGGGQRMCGVTTDDEFLCWGDNTNSAIKLQPDDPWFHPPTMVDLGTEQPVAGIGAGQTNTCVVLGDGRVLCWGQNQYGVVDPGGDLGDLGPMQPTTSAKRVAVGANNACVVTSTSRVRCWGSNSSYKSAPNSTMTNINPSAVDNSTYQAVSLGVLHTCGVRSSGKVACWGSTSGMKLGVDDPLLAPEEMPVVVAGIPNATAIESGTVHSCALAAGDAWCWGHWYQNAASLPRQFESPDGSDFVSLAAGSNFSCAVSQMGEIYCWGDNSNWGNVGQFDGNQPVDERYVEPTSVPVPQVGGGM